MEFKKQCNQDADAETLFLTLFIHGTWVAGDIFQASVLLQLTFMHLFTLHSIACIQACKKLIKSVMSPGSVSLLHISVFANHSPGSCFLRVPKIWKSLGTRSGL